MKYIEALGPKIEGIVIDICGLRTGVGDPIAFQTH
jgi:hypothetical protein